jgi:ubiquinone/menaquinone biosynthesis C-methylase UbiE
MTMKMGASLMEACNPELTRALDAITSGYQHSQILFSAVRGGVFALLVPTATAKSVAAALQWDPRGTRMLLDGLVALGLLYKHGDLYANSETASLCLIPGAPLDQTHIIAHKAGGWNAWARLGEAVASGASPLGSRPDRSPGELRAFILGMDDIGRSSAQSILEHYDMSSHNSMLDVGGGPGSYSLAFAQANPRLRVTVFDLPQVLEITREQIAKTGLSDRVGTCPGDMTEDPLPGGHDFVLLSNIIHSFGPEANRAIIRKCFDALLPGGTLMVKDFLVADDRSGPPFGLVFALHMLVHTEEGDCYTSAEVAEWTTEAGFNEGHLVDITPQSRLWVVTRP